MKKSDEKILDRVLELLLELVLAYGVAATASRFKEIRRLLSLLSDNVQQDSVLQARRRLQQLGYDDEIAQAAVAKIDVHGIVRSTLASAIEGTAASLVAGLVPSSLSATSRKLGSLTSAERSVLQSRLRDGGIAITGRDSRSHRFEPKYYVDLVQHSALTSAVSQAGKLLAIRNGFDLVQISPQPSTIGDYCDLYRGRVFSISGRSSEFPALSDAPQGGPPFHPWCHHYLIPVSGESAVVAAERSRERIPNSFLELGRAAASSSQFQKLWISKRASSSASVG